MLFKRYLVLVAGVLLFLIAYISYYAYANSQIEERFRVERAKFGVQGTLLTTAAPPSADSAPVPGASATPTTAPATPGSAPDSNLLIGPVPPSPATQDNTPPASTTPAAPTDTNSTPMPPSTMAFPRRNGAPAGSPFLVLASYHPFAETPLAAAETAPTNAASPATNATTSPATNAPASEATNAGTASTNAAPSGPARPVPVEASVIVLLYHQFVPAGVSVPSSHQWTMNVDTFEEEMKYIHDNGYHVVPMSDLLKFLKHEIGLPPNSVVITIDDGYKSAIVHAAPILKKYNYPWTFFVYPEFITVNEGAGAASWNDLLALQADGIDIESHSMTHPSLPSHHQKIKGVWHNFSPEEYDQWLTNETKGSKTLLEEKMGRPITCFAYPYGAYNKQVEASTLAAGYEAIFTVADNPVHMTTDLHSIGRYTITRSVVKNFTAYLRQGALGIAEADPAPGGTTTNPRPVITAVLGYAGTLDPKSLETSVRDFGEVRHDFDPKTSTLRLYLPRDLVQPENLVNIRVKDAQTGQVMVANWHFNYEATPGDSTHPPIAAGASTNAAPVSTNAPAASKPATEPSTNAAPATNTPPTTASEKPEKKTTTSPSSTASRFGHH